MPAAQCKYRRYDHHYNCYFCTHHEVEKMNYAMEAVTSRVQYDFLALTGTFPECLKFVAIQCTRDMVNLCSIKV